MNDKDHQAPDHDPPAADPVELLLKRLREVAKENPRPKWKRKRY